MENFLAFFSFFDFLSALLSLPGYNILQMI